MGTTAAEKTVTPPSRNVTMSLPVPSPLKIWNPAAFPGVGSVTPNAGGRTVAGSENRYRPFSVFRLQLDSRHLAQLLACRRPNPPDRAVLRRFWAAPHRAAEAGVKYRSPSARRPHWPERGLTQQYLLDLESLTE